MFMGRGCVQNHGLRPETNAEYRNRLKQLVEERTNEQGPTRPGDTFIP